MNYFLLYLISGLLITIGLRLFLDIKFMVITWLLFILIWPITVVISVITVLDSIEI